MPPLGAARARSAVLPARSRVVLGVGLVVLGACNGAGASAPPGPPPAADAVSEVANAADEQHQRGGAVHPSTAAPRSSGGGPAPSTSPSPPAPPNRPPPPVAVVWTVHDVIDGDTVEVRSSSGATETVRLIGIDAPERGECGARDATAALSALVRGRQVDLVAGARDDRDRYGRLLRYVDVAGSDAGLALIRDGLAIARYDSRDGYGAHPRERAYVAADAASADVTCAPAAPAPAHDSAPAASNPWGASSCHPAYQPCVPPTSEVGDLDCPDIRRHYPRGVDVDHAHGDPHGLDGDEDGHGCD